MDSEWARGPVLCRVVCKLCTAAADLDANKKSGSPKRMSEFRTEIASMVVWPAAVYFDWVARYVCWLS